MAKYSKYIIHYLDANIREKIAIQIKQSANNSWSCSCPHQRTAGCVLQLCRHSSHLGRPMWDVDLRGIGEESFLKDLTTTDYNRYRFPMVEVFNNLG